MDPNTTQKSPTPEDQNPSQQDQTTGADSQIQPGQFVSIGEDQTTTPDVAAGQSPQSAAQPQSVTDAKTSNPQVAAPNLASTQADPATQTDPGFVSQSSSIPQPETSPQTPPTGQSSGTSQLAGVSSGQPDPTPYVPPPAQPLQVPPETPSKIRLLKKLAIVVGIVLLIAIIVVVAWFFVLGKKTQEPVRTEAISEVDEPSPLPKRTNGGFGELPPATSEASPSAFPTPAIPTEELPE